MAVGGYLLAINGKGACELAPGQTRCPDRYDTLAPGIAATAAGAGLVGLSIYLFLRGNSGAPTEAEAHAFVTTLPGGAAVVVTGIFVSWELGLVLILATMVAGCKQDNPLYCDGETPCTDPARPYCDVRGDYGPRNTCVANPFDGPPPAECEASAECEEAAPICTAGMCLACASDEECETEVPGRPLCLEDGRCGDCRESLECQVPEAPICGDGLCRGCETSEECMERDPLGPYQVCRGDGRCVQCLTHEQCAPQVCQLDIGECAKPQDVVHVSPTGSDVGDCGVGTPCATFGYALEQITAERRFIRAQPGTYVEAVTIDGIDVTDVTIVGPGATLTGAASPNQPVLTVRGGATVTVDGLTITQGTGTGAHGVRCEGSNTTLALREVTVSSNAGAGLDSLGCAVTVQASQIENNQGTGVNAAGGSLVLQASQIENNDGGGLKIDGGTVLVENNWIVRNGDVTSEFGGVWIVTPPSSGSLRFNTVADNQAGAGASSSGISCPTGTAVAISSSIVWGNTGDSGQVSGMCSFSYSDVQGGASGTGNLDMDPEFVVAGDYHIKATSPVEGKADPAGGVDVDIDGHSRPRGTGFDMGADEVNQ